MLRSSFSFFYLLRKRSITRITYGTLQFLCFCLFVRCIPVLTRCSLSESHCISKCMKSTVLFASQLVQKVLFVSFIELIWTVLNSAICLSLNHCSLPQDCIFRIPQLFESLDLCLALANSNSASDWNLTRSKYGFKSSSYPVTHHSL